MQIPLPEGDLTLPSSVTKLALTGGFYTLEAMETSLLRFIAAQLPRLTLLRHLALSASEWYELCEHLPAFFRAVARLPSLLSLHMVRYLAFSIARGSSWCVNQLLPELLCCTISISAAISLTSC